MHSLTRTLRSHSTAMTLVATSSVIRMHVSATRKAAKWYLRHDSNRDNWEN